MSSPALEAEAPDKGGLPGYVAPSGAGRPKLLVVGERFEGEKAPFAAKSGQFFRQAMADAGISPDKSGFAWALPELPALLEELGSRWIVLTGNTALQLIRPDLEQSFAHGRPFGLQGIEGPVCYPMFHHGALRRRKEWHSLATSELARLRRMAKDPDGWLKYTGDECWRCGDELHRFDDDGVIYCQKHWELRAADGLELLAAAFNLDSGQAAICDTSPDPR